MSTIICAHCQGYLLGFASLTEFSGNGQAVETENFLCHPDQGMDCYTSVTVYKHSMPCFDCIVHRWGLDEVSDRNPDNWIMLDTIDLHNDWVGEIVDYYTERNEDGGITRLAKVECKPCTDRIGGDVRRSHIMLLDELLIVNRELYSYEIKS